MLSSAAQAHLSCAVSRAKSRVHGLMLMGMAGGLRCNAGLVAAEAGMVQGGRARVGAGRRIQGQVTALRGLSALCIIFPLDIWLRSGMASFPA
jgi:hypothetical protein